MIPFKKSKKKEEEEEVKKGEKTSRKARKRKKEEIKPWGRKERLLTLLILGVTVFISAVLGASAREWKVPGIPRIGLPNISFEKTIILNGGQQEDVNQIDAGEVISNFKSKTKDLSGVYGFFVYRLESEEQYGLFESEIFQAASLIKLPLLITLYQEAEAGNINLDKDYVLKEEDKIGGAGSLQYKSAGYEVTFREMARLMGKQSDNTAFGIIRNQMGDRKIQETIFNLGMTNTSLSENDTTLIDIGLLFERLWKSNFLTKESSDEILELLTDTGFEERIPKGVPDGIRVAHKIGTEVNVIGDAGIIYANRPFVLVIMTKGVVESEAINVLPSLTSLIYDFEILN